MKCSVKQFSSCQKCLEPGDKFGVDDVVGGSKARVMFFSYVLNIHFSIINKRIMPWFRLKVNVWGTR